MNGWDAQFWLKEPEISQEKKSKSVNQSQQIRDNKKTTGIEKERRKLKCNQIHDMKQSLSLGAASASQFTILLFHSFSSTKFQESGKKGLFYWQMKEHYFERYNRGKGYSSSWSSSRCNLVERKEH